MKLSITLICNVLFVNTVLAGVAQRRATRTRGSHPLIPLDKPEPLANATHVEYSSNWAGGILTAPPPGQTFNGVSGQFTVPTPSAPPGSGSGSWSASAWVGIDGDTYSAAIFQAGTDFTVTKSGSKTTYSYDAWYEWYPNYAIDFSNFPLAAGNVISVTVHSTSSSKGTVVMENLTTGKSVSVSVSAPSSSSHLGGQNAEWIVEDFEENGGMVPFADFGTITFTDCMASTPSETLGVSGATIIEIEGANGQVLTDVSLPTSSEVKVVYE